MSPSRGKLSLEREQEILRQLDRYLPPDQRGEHPGLPVLPLLVSVGATNAPCFDDGRGLPTAADVTAEDVIAALNLMPKSATASTRRRSASSRRAWTAARLSSRWAPPRA
ncbi:hypothetical protein ACWEOE_09010 [Amycolatopsis sp. NPDC004368]